MTHLDRRQGFIFTDGACRGNPGPGGWAILSLFENSEGEWSALELGSFAPETTNNRMELQAAIEGVRHCVQFSGAQPLSFTLYLDSKYVIQGITQWIQGWKARGWKTSQGGDVLNRDLWEALDQACQAAQESNIKLSWKYVAGHSGVMGNDRVDAIAVECAIDQRDHHEARILSKSGAWEWLNLGPSASGAPGDPGGKWPRYLSLINGELVEHGTWTDCEARVKGRPGAKYRKVKNAGERSEVLRGWGLEG